MFQFDNIQDIQQYNNQRVVLTVTFDDGNSKDFFGKFEVINDDFTKMITLKNNSKEYEPIEGWHTDFNIQILRPSPFVTLLNYTKFYEGEYDGTIELDDQFFITSFRIIN